MKILGIRFCQVSEEARSLSSFFKSIGMAARSGNPINSTTTEFSGDVFPAGNSWIEVWPTGPEMPAGTMLQIIVDNSDEFAEEARRNGLNPQGPMEEHGERIYYLRAPTGLAVTVQSKID